MCAGAYERKQEKQKEAARRALTGVSVLCGAKICREGGVCETPQFQRKETREDVDQGRQMRGLGFEIFAITRVGRGAKTAFLLTDRV